MPFRDDGEALHDRGDRLDGDLASAKKAYEQAKERRLNHLEEEVVAAQERLRQMQATLGELREGKPAPKAPSKLLAVALPIGLIGLMGFAFGQVSGKCAARKAAQRAAAASMMAPPTVAGARFGGLEAASGPHVSSVRVTWKATVKQASGVPLQHGDACSIEAEMGSTGSMVEWANVRVLCGERVLYKKGDYVGSVTNMGVDEFPGAEPGSFGYNLMLEEHTTLDADKRSQVSIDTEARTAAIWRDKGAAFRVELDIASPLALTHNQAGPLFTSTRFHEADLKNRQTFQARVTQATGQAPVAQGATCTVNTVPDTPNPGGSCRVFIRCGDKAIYGGASTGFAACTGKGATLDAVDNGYTMDDGDPRLHLDMAAKQITVTEQDVSSWSVTLRPE